MCNMQSLVKYCSPDHMAPSYGKTANCLETIGTVLLMPAGHFLSVFVIKELVEEKWSFLLKKIAAVILFILVLPVTGLGALIKGVGRILPHSISAPDDVNYKRTDSTHVELCYEQLRIFSEVCRAKGYVHEGTNIPRFYGIDGTALGALRHQGMIPWDDDVDLMILQEEEPNLLALKEALCEQGLVFDTTHLSTQGLYKLKFTDAKIQEYKTKHNLDETPVSPDLDIMLFAKTTDNCYTFSKILPRCTWPTDYFTQDELDGGVEEVSFGNPARGIKVPILKGDHALAYVKRYYGDDCLDYGIRTHGHTRICGTTIPFFRFGAHRFALTHSKDKYAEGLS